MSETTEQSDKKEKKDEDVRSVIIRSYPNTVYLWPTAFVSLLIYMIDFISNNFLMDPFFDNTDNAALAASLWFFILFFNLTVMSFDFPVGRFLSIMVFVFVFGIVYILFLQNLLPPEFSISKILVDLNMTASANFYFVFTILMLILYLFVYLSKYFSYWEVSPNRIRHHKGFLEREENFSALQSRVVTNIDDVFERVLFRAGTITIVDPEKRVHVLRNVYKAVGKDKQIQKILSVMFTKDGEY